MYIGELSAMDSTLSITNSDNIEFELFSIACLTGQYVPILENIGPAARAIRRITFTNIAQPGRSKQMYHF